MALAKKFKEFLNDKLSKDGVKDEVEKLVSHLNSPKVGASTEIIQQVTDAIENFDKLEEAVDRIKESAKNVDLAQKAADAAEKIAEILEKAQDLIAATNPLNPASLIAKGVVFVQQEIKKRVKREKEQLKDVLESVPSRIDEFLEAISIGKDRLRTAVSDIKKRKKIQDAKRKKLGG